MQKLKNWIEECRDEHEHCRDSSRASKLPTRVVEILGSETVRLKEVTHEEAPYACLSHCWGESEWWRTRAEPIKTTAKTLSSHKVSINWSDLPQTFKDAIKVTRQVGLRYIWIDSLCIIQVCCTWVLRVSCANTAF
jgi:hypothetical protein